MDAVLPHLVRELSEELVAIQQPIRVLDSIAWDDTIAERFFAAGGTRQPEVDGDYYRSRRPLAFDSAETRTALGDLRRRVVRQLGDEAIGTLLTGRIDEYVGVTELLDARGTAAFSAISESLYGGVDDVIHPGGATLISLGHIMNEALTNIDDGLWSPPDEKTFTAEEGVEHLTARMAELCGAGEVRVMLDDGIVADAAAGSDYIKLRSDAVFTGRDLRALEVHEGWVHVTTSLNGRHQPWCTFLGKGTPSTTSTQEGLAVFTEITTMSSSPRRLRKITRRMLAIGMAQDGATFLDVYRWLIDEGLTERQAWSSSVRVFRGSTPESGPFTKDLVYSRGFLEVYDFMRLAVRRGLLERLPLLFSGKLAVHELGLLARLHADGLVAGPAIVPPHMRDISALASWMAYSNVLNRIDLTAMESHLAPALT